MPDPHPTQRLGELIKSARTRHHLSQHELAKRSGIPRSTIFRLETGAISRPRPDLLSAIGRALDVSPAELFAIFDYPADALPEIGPYLRARYHDLSPQSVTELEIFLQTLAERDGITLDDPPTRKALDRNEHTN